MPPSAKSQKGPPAPLTILNQKGGGGVENPRKKGKYHPGKEVCSPSPNPHCP